MKRVVLAVLGTVTGVVALLSFKTSHRQAAAGPLPSLDVTSGSGSTSATPTTSPSGSSSAPAVAGSSPATEPSSSAAQTSRTYLGPAVTTRYGVVQVKVTVSGKRITSVAFAQLTAFDGRSQQINSFAAPQLLQETMDAQSAKIDTVSGATYTSDGYLQSLQSALDAAGI